MKNCEWIVDPKSGCHILMANGEECGRIPAADEIKQDEGKPGSAPQTLEQLKKQLEDDCDC